MRARLVTYTEVEGLHTLTFATESESHPRQVTFTQQRPSLLLTYRLEGDTKVLLTGNSCNELTHFINRDLKNLVMSYHGVFLEMPSWFFGYGREDRLQEACECLSRARFPLGTGAEIRFHSNSYDVEGTKTTWAGTLMHDGKLFMVEERFLEDAVVQLATVFKAGAGKTDVPAVAEHLEAPALGYALVELVKAVPEQAARRALLLIARHLDGQEWDSSTCADVARVMTEAGIPLKDVE